MHALRIKRALRALMERTNDDAYTIFSERRSEKFVQFAGAKDAPLVFDLPSIPLTDDEMRRATDFFRRLGIAALPLSGDDVTFQVDLEGDVERGAELALAVFREVYQLPDDFQLAVEEN
jgi:hypothetical protein